MASEPDQPPAAVHANPNAVADGALVRRTLAGDRRAFDELIVRYQRSAVAVSFRLLGKTDDALEVTQDAFLKAYRSLDTLQKPEAFAGWLMRIVSNLSLNYRRGRRTRQSLPLDDLLDSNDDRDPRAGGDSVDPLRVAAGKELGARLHQALDQLPEKQKMAILLFTIEQLPQKQVAEALDCSVEAVKWHVFQGRKKLREMLKDVL
jgi:RNA polymerase sigma-70 factor, ECF subfamily